MYKRILILGGSGSGKSTLASMIADFTKYPVYHLDNILLDPNWQMRDKSTWEELSQQFLSKSVGIVDGNFITSLPNRILWADLIIYINLPTRVLLYRNFRRHFRVKFGLDKRHGNPAEYKEDLSLEHILWVYNWNRFRGDKILSMIQSAKDKKVVIIKNPAELDIKELLQ